MTFAVLMIWTMPSVFAFLSSARHTFALQTSFLPPNIVIGEQKSNKSIACRTLGTGTGTGTGSPSSSTPESCSASPLKMSLRAWTCHGKTNREMVEKLTLAGIVKSQPVKEALLRVDRGNYWYSNEPTQSYTDAPHSIGSGQTISAPHMHAHALEELLPTLTKMSRQIQQSVIMETKANESDELKILDVGCGSGYLTAALGRLVDQNGPIHPLVKGRVFGIEVIPQLVDMSRNNIMKEDGDLFESGTVTVAKGDGWVGLPENAPYHAIHVGAAAERFPHELMMQLHPTGGVMVIPVGENLGVQNLYRVERLRGNDVFDQNDFAIRSLLGVRYVPLVRP